MAQDAEKNAKTWQKVKDAVYCEIAFEKPKSCALQEQPLGVFIACFCAWPLMHVSGAGANP